MATIEPRTIALRAGSATIRVAQPADAAGVTSLRVALAHESEFLSSEPDEVRTNLSEAADFLGRRLSSTVDLYILAEVRGRVIGIASLDGSTQRRFGHGVTLGLGVCRDHWRQGVGRALVCTLLDWADARGIVRVALEVVESNAAAIRLYEALGFEHEGRLRCRRKHGSVYLDNHVMARLRRPAQGE